MLEIADRISVLRRGKVVGSATPKEATKESLAEMMVGRPVDLVVDKEAAEPGEVVLSVKNLVVQDDRLHTVVDDVSFDVRAGEIVGVAGVQGNGQTELVEAITGLMLPIAGHIELGGQDVTLALPRELHELSVAHVPEDRQRDGLVLDFNLFENLVLDSYYSEPYSRGVRMDWPEARRHSEELIEQYDIRTPSPDIPASSLSGGNQQKLIVAREFSRDVTLVIAAQPTRGIDVGSIEYIHSRIVEERDEGAAILIVSSELEEVMALSDRILVMYRGKIVAEVAGEDATATQLGLFMAGVVS
jgi:simple sugar transport system ATP-binding protein